MSSFERWLPTLFSIPLVGVVLYFRLSRVLRRRRIVGWQLVLLVVLLSMLAAIYFLLLALRAPALTLVGGTVSALVGTGLAVFGLERTQIDVTAEGRFYTPYKWTQVIITTLFVVKVFGQVLATTFREDFHGAAGLHDGRTLSPWPAAPPHQPPTSASPLTLAILFVFAAYYVVYYVGLLRRARALATVKVIPV